MRWGLGSRIAPRRRRIELARHLRRQFDLAAADSTSPAISVAESTSPPLKRGRLAIYAIESRYIAPLCSYASESRYTAPLSTLAPLWFPLPRCRPPLRCLCSPSCAAAFPSPLPSPAPPSSPPMLPPLLYSTLVSPPSPLCSDTPIFSRAVLLALLLYLLSAPLAS